MAASFFAKVECANPIEVFKLSADYQADNFENKVNLGVGAYRTDDGVPWVLPVVRSVEAAMAQDQILNHEYLQIAGLNDFCKSATNLMLGENCQAITENRVTSFQACGGTGALRLAMEFLKRCLHLDTVYVSNPTWGNHKTLAKMTGFKEINEYRYWDDETKTLNFDGLIEDLENAPNRSLIILHMCAHNPTGMDPTMDQWAIISSIVKKKNHFPLFDAAYQGFSSGNVDDDSASLRYFISEGHELFVAQSFSKNFGLYNERVGNSIVVAKTAAVIDSIKSQMEIIIRTIWSNPPNHGARIVSTVLNKATYKNEWLDHVKEMANRILLMRKSLFEKLRALGTKGSWDHIVTQTGMFSYLGLNVCQVEYLNKKYHIYMLKTARINMCGITSKNIDYVANAIHDAVTNIPNKK